MNIRKLYPILLVFIISLIVGCNDELPSLSKGEIGSFTDLRDSREYKTIEIGNQIWMTQNLAFKIDSGIGYWDMDTSSIDTIYGYLYTWETAKKAVPSGWHLPSKDEWEGLINYLGGREVAGGRMKEAGNNNWERPNTDGDNSSGFTARPAGYQNYAGEILFLGEGRWGYWWSSTKDSSSFAWAVRLHNSEASAITNDYNTNMGFSVRCIKD